MEQSSAATGQNGDAPASGGFIASGASLSDRSVDKRRLAFYAELRRERPVYFDPKLNMYLVTRYEDVQEVFRDPVTYSMELGYSHSYAQGYQEEFQGILRREGGGYFRDGIMSDPPVHTRLRRLYEKAFTAHRVKSLEPRIRAVVIETLERVAANGKADVPSEIASPITADFICEQLGFDRSEIKPETIRRWSQAVNAQLSFMQTREQMLENVKDICDLQKYIIARIAEREKEPREDLTSDLVHARIDNDENPELTFEEKVSSVRAMLIAGNETTASAITNMFLVLATEPELEAKCREAVDDDRAIGRFVEELLRREPIVHGLTRMTSREVELGGVLIPARSHMMVMHASANYDESQFSCPQAFDPERSNLGRHVAFGNGIHRCIGAALARMELIIVAQEIVRRFKNIKLAISVEDIEVTPNVSTQVIHYLPITFDRV